MSRLSRLLEKLNVANETPAPRPPPPDVPTGPMTIVIDASRHIVESVTLFRNCTAQVVRTFQDLKLRVRIVLSKGRCTLNAFCSPVRGKYRRNQQSPACDAARILARLEQRIIRNT